MQIDFATISLLLGISSMLNFFMLLSQYLLNKKFTGVLYWLLGYLLIALSMFTDFTGPVISIEKQIFIADILLAYGFILIAAGVKKFFKFRLNKWTFILLFSATMVTAFAFLVHKNNVLEQIILFTIIGTTCLIIATDLYKKHCADRNLPALFQMVLLSILGLLFFMVSVADILNFGVAAEHNNQVLMVIIYLTGFTTSIVATFGFVMIINNELVIDRQQATNLLLQSETKYREDFLFLQSILESSQDIIIFSLDKSYRYTKFTGYHKAVMKRIWGVTIVPGCNMLQIITNEDDRKNAKQCFDRALNGESFVAEEAYGNENRQRFYYENRYAPIKNDNGEITGLSVFVIDITERKFAENAILEAKNHFETLFKISPDATIITRMPGGEIIDVNEAFEISTGYSREEAVGSSTIGLGLWTNGKDRDIFVESLSAKGILINFEADFTKRDGTLNPGMLSAKAYRINGVTHIISITHDLKERKKREDALHLARYALAQSTDAVFWVREDGSFYEANHAAANLLGYNREELLCLTVPQVDPNFTSVRWHNHWRLLKREKSINISSSQFKKDGSMIFTEINANYIDYNGIQLLCSFVKDITERKKAEVEKEKVRRDFDALISSTSDMMWSVDSNYKLIAGNKTFLKSLHNSFGYDVKNGELLLNELHFDNAYLKYWKELYDAALTGKDFQVEINHPTQNNEPLRWTEIHLNPILNGEEVTGVACFGKDISSRKQQEKMMKELNHQIKQRADELTYSNRELEQFAYIASHDLQEPLRMVSSFLKLLEKKYEGKLDEQGLKFINFAVDGATRMRQIILDLLEYSRVGRSERPAELVNMNELMKEIVHVNSITVQECNASITWSPLPEVNTIKISLQQVLQNLISNALKYKQPGVVPVITIAAISTGSFWQIEISDNGIGIDPLFFEKIFEVFQRLHTKEDYTGTGIGLSICKKIIEKLGGKIWVQSQPGKGSTFYFTIKKNEALPPAV